MSSGKANVSPASPKPTLIGFDGCDIDEEIKKSKQIVEIFFSLNKI